MSNPEHVKILKCGIEVWNRRRLDNPSLRPDLSHMKLNPETFTDSLLFDSLHNVVDLRGVDLSGADLSLSTFKNVNMSKGRFDGATMRASRLENVRLDGVSASGATFANCYLDKVTMEDADLTGAIFSDVKTERCDFTRACLRSVRFNHSELQKSRMVGVQMERADLRQCRWIEVDVRASDIREADLESSCLAGCNFTESRLAQAVMRSADLRGSSFHRADLRAADLRAADLRAADLRTTDLRTADLRDTNVPLIRYNRWTKYRGIRLEGCHGSPRFVRFAKDQEYIEEARGPRNGMRFWLLYAPWLISSDCGRSLLIWAAWSLLFAMGYGVKYWCLGPEHFELTRLKFSLATMIYYSLVTFTTLGFGDVVPATSLAAWWVVAEVVTGYIMLGGLIAIFSNKLARRS
jgi:uncharacterized protein YjbI with pentapeptide repeats